METNLEPIQFIEWVMAERQRQFEQWGRHPEYTLVRWLAIITEEHGKLAQRCNKLTAALELLQGDQHEEVGKMQQRLVNQTVQVAACCLAMLQECPALGRQGGIPSAAMGERSHGQ